MKILPLSFSIPMVNLQHFKATPGKNKLKFGIFKRTACPTMTDHTKLSLTVALIKYSTASLDFVFPKKWRPP
jgi:hypothetical protein